MAWKVGIALFSCYYLFIAVKGELVLQKLPLCPGDSAVYKCNVTGSDLVNWEWMLSSSTARYTVFPGDMPRIMNRSILNTPVQFNLTDVGPPLTNIIATVFNPQQLNGTRMTCGGQSLTILIPKQRSFLPSTLTVGLTENGVDVLIYPEVDGNIDNIKYSLAQGSLTRVTSSITVTRPPNILFTITFFQCLYNSTFHLETRCLSVEQNYTLFQNGTWEISRQCGSVLATCNSDGSWSENISCPVISTAMIDLTESDPTEVPTTTSHSSPATSKAIKVSAMTTKYQEMTSTSSTSGIYNMQFPQQCPTSCNTNYSLELVIGSVIGSFVLALILGLVLGLLFGVKFTRTYNVNQVNTSMKKIDFNKGPLYDEVGIDKNVELTQNISYETVKNIK